MSIIVGIDIGGTFTDVCAWDGKTLLTAKSPTTPDDLVRGVETAIAQLPLDGEPFDVIQGSTVATNALLERKGARTAFITTAGFADILRIGRQNRPKLYDLHARKPSPIIDPGDCFEVPERLDADGHVLRPLDEDIVKDLIDAIRARGIHDAAVCLLFSFLNPAHEITVTRIATEAGLRVSRSSEILPEFREFERASTTSINAYVRPMVAAYLERLEVALRQRGANQVRVMQSNGGQISAEIAQREAVRTILSGPAGGVIAAMAVGRAVGEQKLISYDMGGTSTDVSLCIGEPTWSSNSIVDGWPVRVPMLNIHTIGAGGGSIAECDAGGALMVGPRSAGADPGPACYGRSNLPTVTDAHVVLGRLRPEFFLGGQMAIDPVRSMTALQILADQMNLSLNAAALGVLRVANANMERAIKTVSAERGFDPRECMLASFGGCGGLHACELADSLQMRGVIIAAHAGILSALGMLQADVLRDYARSVPTRNQMNGPALIKHFEELRTQADNDVRADGHDSANAIIEQLADMRYRGQSHELTIPIATLANPDSLIEPFHVAHEQTFGYAIRSEPVEIVTLRVRCTVVIDKPTPPDLPPTDGRLDHRILYHQPVFFADQAIATPFYERAKLLASDVLTGPAVIVEPYATTLLVPGWKIDVHVRGNMVCRPNPK